MSESRAVLPDVLKQGLRVVFCGTAPGARSATLGAYYAGPGNKFWPTLHAIGLTPRRLQPPEFRSVLAYGLGLTDLAKFSSGADSSLKRSDFSAPMLRARIARYQPAVLAFTSKRTAREYFGHAVDYGLHEARIAQTLIFTLSSPSGLASGHWQHGRYWHELAALLRSRGI
jgi:TDG/mug DNA glycosylase family protein